MRIVAVRKAIALFLAPAMLAVGANAGVHDGHHEHRNEGAKAPEQNADVTPVRIELADVELVDQDGRKANFRSDVVGDRLAVIDLIYTTCPLVCPILSSILSRVQEMLGDRLGNEVSLVSLSVDPTTDIPPRLKEYAGRYDALPGWTFLTGDRRNVTQALKGLGGYTPDFSQHPSMILVGDGRTGNWTKFYGFPSPERILSKVNELSAARQSKPSAQSR